METKTTVNWFHITNSSPKVCVYRRINNGDQGCQMVLFTTRFGKSGILKRHLVLKILCWYSGINLVFWAAIWFWKISAGILVLIWYFDQISGNNYFWKMSNRFNLVFFKIIFFKLSWHKNVWYLCFITGSHFELPNWDKLV